MITEKNLIKHEFVGLTVKVESRNRAQNGIEGMVVDETKNMMVIEAKGGIKKIPKKTSEFVFMIPNGKKVKVDGKRIAVRPEERIKLKVKKW